MWMREVVVAIESLGVDPTMGRRRCADDGWVQRGVQREARMIVDGIDPCLSGSRGGAFVVHPITKIVSALAKSAQLVSPLGL